jgi:hypothetical protein
MGNNNKRRNIMKNIFSAVCILMLSGAMITGCKGPTGPMGNANVQAKTYTVSSSDWIYTTSPYYEYHVNLLDNDITQDIVDNGMVLVYMSNGNGGWQPLPAIGYTTGTSGSSTYNLEYKYSPVYGASTVTVWYYIVTEPDYWVPGNPGSQIFKVVAASGFAKTSNPNVNWKNYEEVKRALHLRD